MNQRRKANKVNSLLIDGESLLKQGFHGAKQVQTEKGRVGTIFHFINTIKKFYTEYGVTKVVVFWEGENSKVYRQGYYPYYKKDRKERYSDDEKDDLNRQRIRVKQYLEELFIRQVEVGGCEADDGIAHYVKVSPYENKIIYTNDRDLLQLLADDVKVYLADKRGIITQSNFFTYFGYHYGNVGLIKILAGDSSDNISGVEGLGEVKLLQYFPELKKEKKDYEWVMGRTGELLTESPNSKILYNLQEGVTKWGTYGNDYFGVMNTIINLENPNLTEGLAEAIREVVEDPLLPDGRGGVNEAIHMMKSDKLLFFIPKNDDGFFDFWSSFTTIVSKEKKAYQDYKKRML